MPGGTASSLRASLAPATALLLATAACGAGDEDPCRVHLGALCEPGIRRSPAVAVRDAIALDLDGDGALEAIVASQEARSLTIAWAEDRSTMLALPGEPTALAGVDRDGDGLPEVAVALADAAEVLFLDNLGGGALRAGERLQVGADPRDLWIGDLDGDARPEVVTADAADGGVTVIRGADGRRRAYPAGRAPIALASGDLDGDGRLDLVVVDLEGGALQRLRGLPGAEFAAAEAIPVGLGIEWVDLGDVDGDGDLDAITRGRALPTTWICPGDGAGGLGPAAPLELGDAPLRDHGLVAVPGPAGAPSGVAAAREGSIMTWFWGQVGATSHVIAGAPDAPYRRLDRGGAGLVAGGDGFVSVGAAASPTLLEVWRRDLEDEVPPGPGVSHDLDGDGLLDLAIARGGALHLLHGLGGGAFAEVEALPVIDGVNAILIADVDRDGEDDLLLGSSAPALQIAHGLGGGAFAVDEALALGEGGQHWVVVRQPNATRVITADASAASLIFLEDGYAPRIFHRPSIRRIHAGDLDGDGDDDLVVHYGDPAHNLATYTNAIGAREVWEGRLDWFAGVDGGEGVAVDTLLGDLDDDGALELLIVGPTGVHRLDELGGPAPILRRVGEAGVAPGAALTLADADGDGRRDLVAARAGALTILRQGEAGFAAPQTWGLHDAPVVTPAALDDDGRVDAIVHAPRSVRAHLAADRAVAIVEPARRRLPARPRAVTSGDLGGDDRRDLAVHDRRQLTIFWDGDLTRATTTTIDASEPVLAAVDLDGDGVDALITAQGDALVALPVAAEAAPAIPLAALPGPAVTLALLAHDVDGDGRPDLLIARGRPGTVELLLARGRGGGALEAPTRLLEGLLQPEELNLSAGDLDGDGDAEVAIAGGVAGSVRVLWSAPGDRWVAEPAPGRTAVILGEERSLIVLDGDRLRRIPAGDGHLGPAVTVHADPRLASAALRFAADVDGDGRSDLALWSGGPAIRRADAGAFPELLRIADAEATPARIDDLDGDGRPDLVLLDLHPGADNFGVELRLSGGAR